jgi:probable HAF family extracellular repeat protein
MRFAQLSPRKWKHLVAMAALVAVSLFVPMRVCGQTQAYIVRQLSSDDGAAVPCKLNNLGDFAGRAGDPFSGATRATVWNHGSLHSKHFGKFFGVNEYSSALGINDAGEVTGAVNTTDSIIPFLWTLTGGIRHIPLLPGHNSGQALAINKSGHVIGYSSGPNGRRAFLWTRKGSVLDLGVLPGGNYSSASDINDLDEVAGTSGSVAGDRAVLWTKTGYLHDLGTLPGDTSSQANAINNNGDIVGCSRGPRGVHAFLWTQAVGMQDLGVLPGGSSSCALAISNLGEVVGNSTTTSGDRAFIWTKATGMMDLNNATSADLGVVFFEAHSINEKGQILTMGDSNREITTDSASVASLHEHCAPAPPRSFLLTPTIVNSMP